jgi:hypothetical protein
MESDMHMRDRNGATITPLEPDKALGAH